MTFFSKNEKFLKNIDFFVTRVLSRLSIYVERPKKQLKNEKTNNKAPAKH